MNNMARYKVTMQVDYEVEADSIEYAYQLVSEGTEFPLCPYNDDNYCDSSEITSIRVVRDERAR